MIQDRGSIKWASLMLPEHVKALRDWRDTEIYPQEEVHLLDEQENEVLDRLINEAYTNGHTMKLTYTENGKKQTFIGSIHSVDPIQSTLTLIDQFENKKKISVRRIVDIQIQR